MSGVFKAVRGQRSTMWPGYMFLSVWEKVRASFSDDTPNSAGRDHYVGIASGTGRISATLTKCHDRPFA